MFNSMSIKTKILMIIISSILIVSSAILIESIITLNSTSQKTIAKYKKDAYEQKEEELKNYISLAMKTVESYHQRTAKDKVKKEVESYLQDQTNFLFSVMEGTYNKYKNRVSEADLKELIIEEVKASRYGKNGYFWINDTAAKIIMHPIKPQLNGRDMATYKDKGGKRIFFEFAKVAKNNGAGFVDYVWPKPGFEKPQDKVSYVKLFKPFNWVIGTGEYVDNVNEKLQKEALLNIKAMRYGKNADGYFWINDSKHTVIMHAIKDSLNGKNLYDLKDPNGKYVYREIVKIANANKEGGVVDYMWDKPGSSTPQPKLSYVKKFEPWDYIIGTGVYVDDIEAKITQMEEETNEAIKEIIIINTIVVIVITIFLVLLTVYLSKKAIFNPLNDFEKGLLDFFKFLNKEANDVKMLDDSKNDEIGNMAKLINKNIVKTKSLIEQDNALIDDVKFVVEDIKQGHLTKRVTHSTENESLQQLQVQINEMLENLQANIGKDTNVILDALNQYGKLDFRTKIEDAQGKVEVTINELAKIINDMLYENKENGLTLDLSSNILLENVDLLNRNSTSTAAALEETAAALEEITSTVINNTESINTIARHSSELSDSIKIGQELANNTATSMDEINEQTQAIAEAITVIDQIAFQTNILSLNAAVEAATAGEAGKGFAVVAQEVRNLAARSAEAAKEIKELVENATLKTDTGKHSADKMIEGYTKLNENIIQTTELIDTINEASKEQRAGIEQINDAITQLDQRTQQNVVVSNTTHNVAVQTDEIAKLVVSSADEKEFDGKNNVKAKELRSFDSEDAATLVNRTLEQNKKNQPAATGSHVVSDNSSNDEWESF